MENQYGMQGDLRQSYIDGRPLFPAISQPPDLLSCHRAYPYDMLIFRSDHSALVTPNSDHVVAFDAEPGGGSLIDGGAGRWPRQETLSLLEIRSKLDPKFKEANHKGPLWDEVSRIMSQEHGYQRSGKKCREKFENLYKYYKKTKEGKSGRQDGKHYRFFRQLEALYGGDTTNSNSATHLHGAGANTNNNFHYNNNIFPNTNDQEPYHPGSKISDTSHVSIPDSCDYDATSSYCSDSNVGGRDVINNDDDSRMRKRKGKSRSLKAKIEASINEQMNSMMEKQQAWMERMTAIIEGKERERLLREEQWRKQDAARIDGEQKTWAAERAWVEARDAALMEAFNKLAGKEHTPAVEGGGVMWSTESEVKKRKENAKGFTNSYDQNRDPISDEGVAGVESAMRRLHGGGSGDHVSDGLFRYLMGDSYNQRL